MAGPEGAERGGADCYGEPQGQTASRQSPVPGVNLCQPWHTRSLFISPLSYLFFPFLFLSFQIRIRDHDGRSERQGDVLTGMDDPRGGSRQIHDTALGWRVSMVPIAERRLS